MKRKSRVSKGEYPEKLGKILQAALSHRNIGLSFKDQALWDAWIKAVGPIVASQSRVDRFDRETLYVKVSSPVWMQQLQFMKQEITQRINEILGKEVVKKLFFSIGVIAPPPVKKKDEDDFTLQTDLYPLKEREKKLIEKCAASLADRELGDILKRAMTKNIIRRKMNERR